MADAAAKTRTLAILFLATLVAYADRYLFSVAAEQIRLEFGLNDFELGLLAGPALAIFYATLGVSLARWADVGHRPRLLAVCVALWSAFTLACGLAAGFAHMLLARIGLGIGEAGAFPPAHSLVAGASGSARRGVGAAVLSLATFLGAFVGSAVGGLLVGAVGWRWAFVAFGAVGALIAPLVILRVPEPRAIPRRPPVAVLLGAGLGAVFGRLLRRPAFFNLLAGYTLYFVFAHTVAAFGVVFMIRAFGLVEAEVGAPWGLTLASSTIAGTLAAVLLVDRLASRAPAWYGRLPALMSLVAGAAFLAGFSSGAPGAVYAFLWIGSCAAAVGGPAIFAGVYAETAEDERATAIALMLFSANSVGLGLGPLLGGLASTLLAPVAGVESIRWVLLAAALFLFWAAVHFARAARAFAAGASKPATG
jgi:MFS family permease